MTTTTSSEIAIVGGSLAGLTLALACAARGVPVRIFERSSQRLHGGDSLSVDLAALAATTGHDPRVEPRLPVVPAYRDRHLVTWSALHGWLQARVIETPGVQLEQGRAVAEVVDLGDQARILFADGSERLAPAVIGADGYHSIVRRAITLQAPYARYAGYLVWRGLVEESALSRPVSWPSDGGLWIEFVEGYRLVAAVLPGRDGSMAVGQRQVTFAWFDVHRDELLRQTGCLTDDGHIVATLGRGTIADEIRADLEGRVPALWPAAWAEAVSLGVAAKTVLSGAPIAEYRPDRLAAGVLAIVGDAAHVVSPMTGSGFATGVDDAFVLARLLADRPATTPITETLAAYEASRLPYVRGLVAHSARISADYAAYGRQA